MTVEGNTQFVDDILTLTLAEDAASERLGDAGRRTAAMAGLSISIGRLIGNSELDGATVDQLVELMVANIYASAADARAARLARTGAL